MTLHRILVEGSSVFKEARAGAVAKATAKGLEEGRIEGERKMLRLFLADRFPGLEAMPELDLIDTQPTSRICCCAT